MSNFAQKYQQQVIETRQRDNQTIPLTADGVKYSPLFPIPVDLWIVPILHLELGIVLDVLQRFQGFVNSCVEKIPKDEAQAQSKLEQKNQLLIDLKSKLTEKNTNEMKRDILGLKALIIAKETQNTQQELTIEEEYELVNIRWYVQEQSESPILTGSRCLQRTHGGKADLQLYQ